MSYDDAEAEFLFTGRGIRLPYDDSPLPASCPRCGNDDADLLGKRGGSFWCWKCAWMWGPDDEH